jgi:hypothetical protein
MRAMAKDFFALRSRFEKVDRQLKKANDMMDTVKRDSPMLYSLFEYHAEGGRGRISRSSPCHFRDGFIHGSESVGLYISWAWLAVVADNTKMAGEEDETIRG